MNTEPKKRPNRADLAVSLLLIGAGLLLVSNVSVLGLASAINDRACQSAAIEAVKAYNLCDDQRLVMRAAFHGLSSTSLPNPFMEHPQFTEFRYEKSDGKSIILVQTATNVKLPVPMLAFNPGVTNDGRVWLHQTYRVTVKD